MTTARSSTRGGWPLEQVRPAHPSTVSLTNAALVPICLLLLAVFVVVDRWLCVALGACQGRFVSRGPST